MIYITGDIHGCSGLQRLYNFADKMESEGKPLGQKDCIIVLGDFGLIWHTKLNNDQCYQRDERLLDDMSTLPFKILFIDGNHENFDRLGKYPKAYWHWGKVAVIRRNIYHLLRGQVFDIYGIKILTMGGAESIDRFWREPGISWWSDETITDSDMNEAKDNLEKNDWTVDYVLTHTAPVYISRKLVGKEYESSPSDSYLSELEKLVKFKKWYFGHHHTEKKLGKFTALYENIMELK